MPLKFNEQSSDFCWTIPVILLLPKRLLFLWILLGGTLSAAEPPSEACKPPNSASFGRTIFSSFFLLLITRDLFGISSLNLSSESLDLPSRSPLNKTLHWRLSTQASPSGESHIRNCLPPHNKCFLTSANVLPYTARYFIRLFCGGRKCKQKDARKNVKKLKREIISRIFKWCSLNCQTIKQNLNTTHSPHTTASNKRALSMTGKRTSFHRKLFQ